MARLKLLLIVFLLGVSACGSIGNKPFPYSDPIVFFPNLSSGNGDDSFPDSIEMQTTVDGQVRTLLIDTGSVYYFLGTKDNSMTLPCLTPEKFYYGEGVATFCPDETVLKAETVTNQFVVIDLSPVAMGRAFFTEWQEPYGIIGFSANFNSNLNRTGMTSIIDSLQPDFLSFSFPNGLTASGFFQFSSLNRETSAPRIPLVDPGTLDYGYTATIERLDYMIAGEIHTSLLNEFDGVYLEVGGERTRIAEKFLSFFDTGTTLPILLINGDVSLMSDQVASVLIEPQMDAPLYDQLAITFKDENGNLIEMVEGDLEMFQPENPWAHILTPGVVQAGQQQLVAVLGLNFIGRYDFQFDFESGMATSITFYSR